MFYKVGGKKVKKHYKVIPGLSNKLWLDKLAQKFKERKGKSLINTFENANKNCTSNL